MATKILFSPKFPKPIYDIAVEMTPPGFELVPVDSISPQFLEAAKDAEYFMGFGRNPLSHDFYAAGKNIKLVQLISAGYNTLDLEAAKKAKVPISNNGGANSVAVAEHAVMLILATLKKLAWQHKNCVEGKWRVGDFAETRLYELEPPSDEFQRQSSRRARAQSLALMSERTSPMPGAAAVPGRVS
jgi:lactate dehydrogenase-like 2-hydroxyacid dehydrogenase